MKYRPLCPNDVEGTVKAMLDARASYAGLSTAILFTAICRDSIADIRHQHIIIIVAEENCEIAGYVIATLGNDYLMHFICRHPLIATKAVWKRLRKKIRRRFEASAKNVKIDMREQLSHSFPFISAGSGRSWRDQDEHTAKIIHIGVCAAFRRRSVAVELYRYLYDFLLHLDITRIDANIDNSNTASIRMHHNTGWTISTNGSHLFATIDLRHEI